MKPHSSTSVAVIFASLLVLAGCADTPSGSVYNRSQTRNEMSVRMGVVQAVRSVVIEGSQSGVGAVAGGAVGGVAGSNVGEGKGATIGTILGAVAGGVAGQAIEERFTRKDGLEITIKLDNGSIIAITQMADEPFKVGDTVRVLSGNGATRVSR
jgi:outer membrane lipoprotein SlyB